MRALAARLVQRQHVLLTTPWLCLLRQAPKGRNQKTNRQRRKAKQRKLKLRSYSGAHARVAMEVMVAVQSGTLLRALRVQLKRRVSARRGGEVRCLSVNALYCVYISALSGRTFVYLCVDQSFSWNFPKFPCLSPWLGLFASRSPCERVAQWLVDDVGRN